ncbi:TRAP transporter large permease subunit [Pseudomonadales bacterium]|jgi:tripartite ATP-independent transporter DctM subunit|nr:TRAP transporter large permease subunit [Pseudomonadales bacterium]
MTDGDWLSLWMFVSFILLIFSGFPVAWVLGGLAVIFTAVGMIAGIDFGWDIAISWDYSGLVVDRIWDVMNNWVLVALPMFIFMGVMLEKSGLAERLLRNLSTLLNAVPGGMALSVVGIGVLLSASTGIIGASVVLLGLLAMPPMLARGYQAELAAGTIAAVGSLGILVPPSIMLVMMADRLALPVGPLFLGALIPGLMLAGLYAVYIVMVAILKPKLAPRVLNPEPLTLGVLMAVVQAMLPPLMLIFAVLGSIFTGIATPTEAAGVGAAGALILTAWYANLTPQVLRQALLETTKTTSYIFAIFLGATAFSLVLRGLGGDHLIEKGLLGLPFGPDGILITILLVVFLLGFVLDWIEITLIVLPLVAPVVTGLGFDLIWFTVLFAVCLQTAFLTPPVGFAIFYLKGVVPDAVTVPVIYRGVVPFIALQLLGLVLIYCFSDLVLYLPSRLQ